MTDASAPAPRSDIYRALLANNEIGCHRVPGTQATGKGDLRWVTLNTHLQANELDKAVVDSDRARNIAPTNLRAAVDG